MKPINKRYFWVEAIVFKVILRKSGYFYLKKLHQNVSSDLFEVWDLFPRNFHFGVKLLDFLPKSSIKSSFFVQSAAVTLRKMLYSLCLYDSSI